MSFSSFLMMTAGATAPLALEAERRNPEEQTETRVQIRAANGPARHAHSHTHAKGEIDEEHGPILFEVTYTSEVMAVVDGGLDRGARYLDNFDIVLEADMESLVGWQGAELHLYGLYNNGESISELAGDAFAVSNIESDAQAFRLYEAWVEQKFGGGLSIKAGLYDLNSEFDALDASGLFVGSAHGIGADISQTGLNGPSIFPVTSLAVRVEQEFAPGWKLRAAVLDAVPGDPNRPGDTVIRLGDGDGALGIAELEVPVAGGRLLLGHWRYTADFDLLDGGRDDGNAGTYIRGEASLLQGEGSQLDGFFRFGTAAGRFNMFGEFASAGLKLTGLFAEDDEAGLAVAHGWTSDAYRSNTGSGKGETVFELTWRKGVTSFLTIQPSLQYVVNPSADPTIDNALVLGLRAETSFQF